MKVVATFRGLLVIGGWSGPFFEGTAVFHPEVRASFEGCSSSLGGIGHPGIGHFLIGCRSNPWGPWPFIIGVGAGAHVTAGFPEKKTGQFPASLPPFSAQRKEVPARHERRVIYAAARLARRLFCLPPKIKRQIMKERFGMSAHPLRLSFAKNGFMRIPPFFTQRKREKKRRGIPPNPPRVVSRLS